MRNFFIATAGQRQNEERSIVMNNITFQSIDYPTYRDCINLSDQNFPNLDNVLLISITEINEVDFEKFTFER